MLYAAQNSVIVNVCATMHTRASHLSSALVIRVPRWQLRMVLDDNLMRLWVQWCGADISNSHETSCAGYM